MLEVVFPLTTVIMNITYIERSVDVGSRDVVVNGSSADQQLSNDTEKEENDDRRSERRCI